MNDRFKFRCWDKPMGEYENIPKLLNQKGELIGSSVKADLSTFYDIEMSTGLKDKNGKLIYEGDIVRQISKKEPEWEEYVTEVKWKGCGFNLYRDDEFDFLIIGNIHENKELLDE